GGRHGGGPGDGDERGRNPAQEAAGPPREPWPEQQERQGEQARRDRGRVEVRQLGGQGAEVVGHGALRGAAEDDVHLGDGDGDADAGEHAVHDRGADGERAAGHPQAAQAQLGEAGEDGDGAGGAPAVALNEVGGDDGESGGRTADLEGGTAEQSGDETADGGGDQAGLERRAGGEGDAEGQGEGDEEDRDRGRHVGARDARAARSGRRRAVGRVGALGPVQVGGAGGDAG